MDEAMLLVREMFMDLIGLLDEGNLEHVAAMDHWATKMDALSDKLGIPRRFAEDPDWTAS